MALVRNVVGCERVGPRTAKLVAMLDDVAVETEEDNVAIVTTEDVVVALGNTTPEGLVAL